MRITALPRFVALLITMVFVLAACGPAATDPTPTPDPATTPDPAEPTPEPEETPDPAGPPEGQASEFTVAFTSIGLSSLPTIAAIDELRAQGYTIDTPELAESELVTEGVAQGRFQFGSGANNATLRAIEQGADIKWIVDRNHNEWTVYSKVEIDECEELVDSRVAIHSPGSVSGAMIADWVRNNCPDAYDRYEPLIIAGSQNRLAALIADQIDATPLELGDAIVLEEEHADEFHLQVSFARDLPELHPTSVYGNVAWMEENPDVTRALIREILEQHRRINSEPGYLFDLLAEYLPEEAEDEDVARTVTETYVREEIFDNNGGLDQAAVEYTATFFGPDGTGDVDEVFSFDDVADLSYLEAVLDEIGRE
jgi:NitT/TauT family transport system substrate-binding protein